MDGLGLHKYPHEGLLAIDSYWERESVFFRDAVLKRPVELQQAQLHSRAHRWTDCTKSKDRELGVGS